MEINLTIFVQVVNFVLAAVILKLLLFNPIIKALGNEEKSQNHLINQIQAKEDALANRAKLKKQEWLKCQKYFQKHCPQVEPFCIFTIAQISDQQKPIALSKSERDHLAKHIQKALVERIQSVANS